jgi:hypothetical protein
MPSKLAIALLPAVLSIFISIAMFQGAVALWL